jgi:hypothetical protein
LLYLFEEELKKKSWYQSKGELQSMIDDCNEILNAIFKTYPSATTTKVVHKITLTKNAAALIILAQAENLYNVLQLLQEYLKEVRPLPSVIKKGS